MSIAPGVQIADVAASELEVLRQLFQLYEYDFSEIDDGARVADDGRFHHLDHLEFAHAYFIRVDGALAGFALVNRQSSHVNPDDLVWSMEEFFVMRPFRRRSVGRRAAELVIGLHPGTWEVTETPDNGAAIAFWRTVLAPYDYEEVSYDDPRRGPRPLQRFTAEGPVGKI